jgi:Flp pilus assembly pilin Flp
MDQKAFNILAFIALVIIAVCEVMQTMKIY